MHRDHPAGYELIKIGAGHGNEEQEISVVLFHQLIPEEKKQKKGLFGKCLKASI